MKHNEGVATIEMVFALPLFLFAMVSIYHIIQCKLTEIIIYEGCVQSLEYMAEYGYISESGALTPYITFQNYADNPELINRYVEGGINGVSFLGSIGVDDEGYSVIRASYNLKLNVPLIPRLTKHKTITIRQKAYLGMDDINQDEGMEYVYITNNQEVYHTTRRCTHLQLSITSTSRIAAEEGSYTPCEFCGDNCEAVVYITEEGNRYHSTDNCNGLRRYVYRVEKTSVEGVLGGCNRCLD